MLLTSRLRSIGRAHHLAAGRRPRRGPAARSRGPRIIVRAGDPRSIAALAAFSSLVAAAAGYGARNSPARPATRAWYGKLEKAPFNPPDFVFAPVWTVLYSLIATSGWRVWRKPAGAGRTAALSLWGAQLVANAAWTRLFFGAKRPRAALADIAGLLALISSYMSVSRRVDRPATLMMLPYGAWVAFALLLNEEIVRRN